MTALVLEYMYSHNNYWNKSNITIILYNDVHNYSIPIIDYRNELKDNIIRRDAHISKWTANCVDTTVLLLLTSLSKEKQKLKCIFTK